MHDLVGFDVYLIRYVKFGGGGWHEEVVRTFDEAVARMDQLRVLDDVQTAALFSGGPKTWIGLGKLEEKEQEDPTTLAVWARAEGGMCGHRPDWNASSDRSARICEKPSGHAGSHKGRAFVGEGMSLRAVSDVEYEWSS